MRCCQRPMWKKGWVRKAFAKPIVARPVEPVARELAVESVGEARSLRQPLDELDEEPVERVGRDPCELSPDEERLDVGDNATHVLDAQQLPIA